MGQQKDTQGDGGGPLIGNPGAAPDQGRTENAKDRNWKDPSGDLPGTTAQEEADRKRRSGQGG